MRVRRARVFRAIVLLLLASAWGGARAQAGLPDAPLPQMSLLTGDSAAAGGAEGGGQETFPPAGRRSRGVWTPGMAPNYVPVPRRCRDRSCSELTPQPSCCQAENVRFADYLKQNALPIYTSEQLGKMAVRGVIDPFNLLTIAYTSAFSIATDSHSPFGPGMPGFAKLSGVALTQDMTGEFFGTWLIPSIDHQDPYFHRIPNASLARRIAHCVYQVFWTENVRGQGIVNYSTVLGVPAEEAVGTIYIPYQQIGWKASAERVGTDWATAPIGNFVTEFVPEVARHINLHVVILQRVINQVAAEEAGGPAAQ